jgi:hypothetical protein
VPRSVQVSKISTLLSEIDDNSPLRACATLAVDSLTPWHIGTEPAALNASLACTPLAASRLRVGPDQPPTTMLRKAFFAGLRAPREPSAQPYRLGDPADSPQVGQLPEPS